ncbi:MAG: hypothetical protein EZS28_014673 [Streblomastix strix]|uniref:Uncharacterized protein n=1 Tax=Streblomastix strix TaxID=222440 RepID=A0A5J4W4D6_9EUKA|nr:MAG: hypothetical protein EZS28_014673 [Streblomastix strix]
MLKSTQRSIDAWKEKMNKAKQIAEEKEKEKEREQERLKMGIQKKDKAGSKQRNQNSVGMNNTSKSNSQFGKENMDQSLNQSFKQKNNTNNNKINLPKQINGLKLPPSQYNSQIPPKPQFIVDINVNKGNVLKLSAFGSKK